jgi:8-oxo-dGTP diphosphatase
MKLATLCYVRDQGKTLMVHRIKKENDIHLGKWNGLGGKLEPGETPEECAAREIFEESGLVVRRMNFKGMLTFPGFSNDEDWYAFVFVIDEYDGTLVESPEGTLHWVVDEDVPGLNLWEGDRFFLPWLDKPGFFSGKFTYVDNRLVDHYIVGYP